MLTSPGKVGILCSLISSWQQLPGSTCSGSDRELLECPHWCEVRGGSASPCHRNLYVWIVALPHCIALLYIVFPLPVFICEDVNISFLSFHCLWKRFSATASLFFIYIPATPLTHSFTPLQPSDMLTPAESWLGQAYVTLSNGGTVISYTQVRNEASICVSTNRRKCIY